MRIRGGTRGILTAIEAGRLDPLDPWLPEERIMGPLKGALLRQLRRRAKRRARSIAKRLPF